MSGPPVVLSGGRDRQNRVPYRPAVRPRSAGYCRSRAACPGKLDSALPHDHCQGTSARARRFGVEGATMLFRRSLLDRVERGALNPRHDLSDLLRMVIALGGQAGSADLRDWARLELDGYAASTPEAVPAYRVVQAPINANGSDGFHSFTSMMISVLDLPDFTREYFSGGLHLTMGVAELELLAIKGEIATLQTPPMQDLASIMNRTGKYSVTLERVYYSLSPVTVAGVLSSIRTNLVALVSEIRGTGGVTANGTPTAAAANHAVQVVLKGRARATINTAIGEGASVTNTSVEQEANDSSGAPGWIRKPWVIAVGLTTILSGVAALAQWAGWNPF